jgi:LysR family transcriptional regulator, chromosome initiation inhibitor
MRALDRQQLEAFAEVIEKKSFDGAAAALNVTRGAISQRIKALEQSLSTLLVVRGRPARPTSAGRVVMRHITALRLLEGRVFKELTSRSATMPHLSIGVHPDSLETWFAPLVIELMKEESFCVEVISDDRCHTLDLLAHGSAQGCVSVVPRPLDGFTATPLGAMQYCLVSTAEFRKKYFSGGVSPHALLKVPALVRDRKDTRHSSFLRCLFGFEIDRYPCHYVPMLGNLIEALRAGAGYAVMPLFQVAQMIDCEEMVDLAPSTKLREDLFWHSWITNPAVDNEIGVRIVETARKTLSSADV